VALKKTFEALATELDELLSAANTLQGRAWDPPQGSAGHALVRIVGEDADDVHGWLTGACGAAREAMVATDSPIDPVRALGALVGAKDGYLRAADVLARLLAPERLAEIDDAGSQSSDWHEWSAGVVDALEHCREQNVGLVPGLFACFEELAERATAGAVSVQTTSIGQQVTIPRDALASEAVP
jgi:hypothetical protein